MDKLKIGITIGDINGISPEVVIKALSDERILEFFTPIIYGSDKTIAYHKNIVDDEFTFKTITQASESDANQVNVLNCWDEIVNITLGEATEDGGKFAAIALERAIRDCKNNDIDGLVTAPINKYAMKKSGFKHPGHTEYITEQYGDRKSLMMMVSDNLRVGLVTNHLPIQMVPLSITKENILDKLNIMNTALKDDFGIDKPTIAVLGLNPHAGDEGSIGKEDEEIVKPAILEAKESGVVAMGPFPADGFFGSSDYTKCDAVLAMYHDQGLVPFKALSFGNGVNYTAGLPIVRTSPDHGTAYDIAGQNVADCSSIQEAMFRAVNIINHRRAYDEERANPLKRRKPNFKRGKNR